MGGSKEEAPDAPSTDLPWDPQSRYVNWEVLKRLSLPKIHNDGDAYKVFMDDAPYKKYVETQKAEDDLDSEAEALRRFFAVGPKPRPEPESTGNRFQVSQGFKLAPWSWLNIASVFDNVATTTRSSLGASTSFSLHQPQKQHVSEGHLGGAGVTVLGQGALAVSHRHNRLAFGLSSSSLMLRRGSAQAGASNPPSLKATVALEQSEDTYIAASYDVLRNAPELSMGWSGQTATDKAFLYASVGRGCGAPAMMGGAVSFAGPEWRPDIYDPELAGVVPPPDHGGRHKLWLEHQFGGEHRSRAGGSLDLSYAANAAVYFWRRVAEGRLLPWTVPLWHALPFGRNLRNALLPPPHGDDYLSFRFSGWQLDASHTFDSGRVMEEAGLSCPAASGVLRLYKDFGSGQLGLEWRRGALRVGGRTDASGVASQSRGLPVDAYVTFDLFASR